MKHDFPRAVSISAVLWRVNSIYNLITAAELSQQNKEHSLALCFRRRARGLEIHCSAHSARWPFHLMGRAARDGLDLLCAIKRSKKYTAHTVDGWLAGAHRAIHTAERPTL